MSSIIIPGAANEHRAYNRIIDGLKEAKAGAEQLAYYRSDERERWSRVALQLEAMINLIYDLEVKK